MPNENLGAIIETLYDGACTKMQVVVVLKDKAIGPEIESWNVPGVPEPTVAEVMAREPEYLAVADKTQKRVKVGTKVSVEFKKLGKASRKKFLRQGDVPALFMALQQQEWELAKELVDDLTVTPGEQPIKDAIVALLRETI